ncbi:hypothetical protein [Mesorhizobium sp. M7A.F.Ca.ET.027.03.2.1]|uniref:hypothetical protein n=1 Tax=Mesorhizobium sp. M7A.F.Ca.ET.027.03.2.1 TaxID=2496656 RepID=UPI000FC9AD25|nr:hypothetical protein [Mesorhizobium sp. M7A.F.Ca.ET.027.03.2.1]RVD50425.1 hypothetical protein EN750_32510 [Mesorhizobium sp. M7A.F.Ca.ET.027.03.2.1]
MTLKIKGMRFFDEDDGRNGFTVLAHAEIEIEDLMNLNNVTLAWSADRGYTALAPMGRDKSGLRSVIWNSDSPFARLVAEKMRAMYHRMGGKNPPAADLQLVKEREAAIAKAKSGEIEHRVFPATFTVNESEPEADDAAGLHRMLGVDPVSETMVRAGL